MRICLLSYRGNMYCGGQGIYLYYLSKALAELGHEIHVLVGPPLPLEMPWAKVHIIENHNFFMVNKGWLPKDNPLAIFRPWNLFEFALTRFGFFPEMLAYSFRAFRKIAQLIRETGPFDVIHDNQCLGYGLIAMKGFGAPVLSTVHHPLAIDRKESFWQTEGLKAKAKRIIYYPPIMQKIVTRNLDRIITVSKVSAKAIEEAYGVPESEIRVVYNGVDTSNFRPPATPRNGDGKTLIFVGNTEDRKKGILYLLKAMTKLPEDVKLICVNGGAPRHIYAQELVEKLGISHRVIFTGRLPVEKVAEKYREADIAVVPSLFEGFGLPAAEAMASGLPVVSTDGGALPEVVGTDGKSAILVPARSSSAIAEAVMQLINNPERRRAMGISARERALKLFTWENAAKEIVEIYKEEIARKRVRNTIYYSERVVTPPLTQ